MICNDIWHKYHSWYFKIVSNLRMTISKYHSCYLCQISLQIMLLPIQISKFIIYMSLSIPEYSSLHPGLFKWIWIPAFAIISLHALHPSPSATLNNKDHSHWCEESSSLCPANDRPPEVAQLLVLKLQLKTESCLCYLRKLEAIKFKIHVFRKFKTLIPKSTTRENWSARKLKVAKFNNMSRYKTKK